MIVCKDVNNFITSFTISILLCDLIIFVFKRMSFECVKLLKSNMRAAVVLKEKEGKSCFVQGNLLCRLKKKIMIIAKLPGLPPVFKIHPGKVLVLKT